MLLITPKERREKYFFADPDAKRNRIFWGSYLTRSATLQPSAKERTIYQDLKNSIHDPHAFPSSYSLRQKEAQESREVMALINCATRWKDVGLLKETLAIYVTERLFKIMSFERIVAALKEGLKELLKKDLDDGT